MSAGMTIATVFCGVVLLVVVGLGVQWYQHMVSSRLHSIVFLPGIHTHICVEHTVYGAFIRGYNAIIAEDGVNASTKKDHHEGLEYIRNNYGASIKKVSDIIKDL